MLYNLCKMLDVVGSGLVVMWGLEVPTELKACSENILLSILANNGSHLIIFEIGEGLTIMDFMSLFIFLLSFNILLLLMN